MRRSGAGAPALVALLFSACTLVFADGGGMGAAALPGETASVGIVFPSSDQRVYGHWPVLFETDVRIEAYDREFTEDVTSVAFEYSANATDWNVIGTDTDPRPDPPITEDPISGVVPGYSGWNVIWDTSALSEGKYSVRATVSHSSGPPSQGIREVYFTPAPPTPQILGPAFLEVVRGRFEVSATTSSPSIQSMDLEILAGSDGRVEQKGFNLGSGSSDLWPSSFCAPSGAAQAIWRLAGKNKGLLTVGEGAAAVIDQGKKKYGLEGFPDGEFVQEGKLTFKGLMVVLAVMMGTETQEKNGATPIGNIKTGIEKFLKQQKLNCQNADGYTVKHLFKPTFQQYETELRQGESLIINQAKWKNSGRDQKAGTRDDGTEEAHVVVGADSAADPGKKENKASFLDTCAGQDLGEWNWRDNDANAGGFSTISSDLWQYQITDLFSISPKNKKDIPDDTPGVPVPGGTDRDGGDGWRVPSDSSDIDDGFYLLGVTMTDAAGNWGQDFTTVYVNNRTGGIVELPVGQPDAPARATEGSGPSAPPYAALAGGLATAALVALTVGAWYARRRLSR